MIVSIAREWISAGAIGVGRYSPQVKPIVKAGVHATISSFPFLGPLA